MKIAYEPLNSSVNEYTDRCVQILAELGGVEAVPRAKVFFKDFKQYWRYFDFALVNWLENRIITKKGSFSVIGSISLFLKIVYLRIISKKVIYVRHNVYPHGCSSRSIWLAKITTDIAEFISSASITHSGHNANSRRYYVPHPLYEKQSYALKNFTNEDYFLIFGRIEPYKHIEKLIVNYSGSAELLIAGPCSDENYLNLLKSVAAGKNVQFRAEYLNAEQAKELVRKAKACVLPHSGSDMVVSGSYFFSLTQGTPVLALHSPFLAWSVGTLKQKGTHLFSTSAELLAYLQNYRGEDKEAVYLSAVENFGDAAVREKLIYLFSRL